MSRNGSQEGRLPITLFGGDLHGGVIKVSGEISSQYTSALLFAAPLIDREITIEVTGDMKSQPPIRQTLQVLQEAGIAVTASADLKQYTIPAGQRYLPRTYTVPGDYPGAAALMAAAAVTESDVTIERLFNDQQGEREAIDVLKQMGADISHDGQRVRIRGGKTLNGGTFDGDRFTDAVPALAGAATAADGTTIFMNVENLRYKECDRISDYRAELNRIGAQAHEERDKLIITGHPAGLAGGAEADSHVDHRVIMGLTIAALRADKPVLICNAQHVAKSYPAFFDHLRQLGARIDEC
jgi:3-phosphoshikimate 1-carboxyvinyltransferase